MKTKVIIGLTLCIVIFLFYGLFAVLISLFFVGILVGGAKLLRVIIFKSDDDEGDWGQPKN